MKDVMKLLEQVENSSEGAENKKTLAVVRALAEQVEKLAKKEAAPAKSKK